MGYKKSDITLHRDGFRGARPAIKVKCYHFADQPDAEGRSGAERLAAETGLPVKRCETLLERAWEYATMDFWNYLAPEAAREVLAKPFGIEPQVYSEGRSSGWLVIDQLTGAEDWDAPKVTAWGRFEQRIRDEIAYLCDYENVKENLAANDDLDPDGEKREAAEKAESIVAPYGGHVEFGGES